MQRKLLIAIAGPTMLAGAVVTSAAWGSPDATTITTNNAPAVALDETIAVPTTVAAAVAEPVAPAPTTTQAPPTRTAAPVVAEEAEPEADEPPTTTTPARPSIVPDIGGTDRNAALTLPATTKSVTLWGNTVSVVARYAGSSDSFVVEYADGRRALVLDLDGLAYVYPLVDDVCHVDPFGVIKVDYAKCSVAAP